MQILRLEITLLNAWLFGRRLDHKICMLTFLRRFFRTEAAYYSLMKYEMALLFGKSRLG